MSIRTNERLNLLREESARFASEQLNTNIDIVALDRQAAFDRAGWKRCAEFGLLRMAVPEKHGGKGASLSELIAVMEGLGAGADDLGLLFSLNAHLWTVIMQLVIHGTSEQHTRYLPGLLDGSLIGANGSTESGSGSDVFSMVTRAVKDRDHFIINGEKTYITNAPIADLFVIYATVDPQLGPYGVTAFLVEAKNPGIILSEPFDKMGMRTAQMGRITLKDCRVPVDSILGKEGRGARVFESAMEHERGCILAAALGGMHRLLEICIDHARTRQQFGQPISKNQAISHRIADMKVNLDAARELVYRVGHLKDHGKSATLEAASAKLFVSETYADFSLNALRIFGAKGYMTESSVQRGVRDSIASLIYSGTSDIQRNIIASELGL